MHIVRYGDEELDTEIQKNYVNWSTLLRKAGRNVGRTALAGAMLGPLYVAAPVIRGASKVVRAGRWTKAAARGFAGGLTGAKFAGGVRPVGEFGIFGPIPGTRAKITRWKGQRWGHEAGQAVRNLGNALKKS